MVSFTVTLGSDNIWGVCSVWVALRALSEQKATKSKIITNIMQRVFKESKNLVISFFIFLDPFMDVLLLL